MATGEKAGTWGTLTNTNWDIIEQISGGYTTQALTDNDTVALAKNDGTTGATLATRVIKLTGSLGDVSLVGHAYVYPDGIGLTATAQGSAFAWAPVDKGDSVSWSSAGKGTSVTWTPVDKVA